MTDKKLLTKIAYYYYKLELTQNDIAGKLGMSRQRVNRLLKRCRDEGLVEIRIAGFEESYVELEGALESAYGLKQVIITPEAEDERLHDVLGAAAADYVVQSLSAQKTIGVSWGRTIYSMAQHLQPLSPPLSGSRVLQLVGNMVNLSRDVQPDEVTRLFASKLGATPVLLYAPVYMKNKVAKFTLMHEQSIKSVFDLMPQCEVMFCSVSGIDNNYKWLNQTVIEERFIEELQARKAVGNICLRYFDAEGACVEAELHRLEVGIDGQTIKNIPNVVCVAGGAAKFKAVHSAVKGGFVNTLITDRATADYLNRQGPAE